MAQFSLVGSPEPFLHVSMRRGDKIYCESNAMVMMEAPLELKGRLQGGLMQSLLRRFANEESLFQQHIEAVRGDGDCLLSAALDGDMQILDVGATQYILSDGAFVAAHDSVEIKARLNSSIGGAFFGIRVDFWSWKPVDTGRWWLRVVVHCLNWKWNQIKRL
jgi:uncharacterized protein (AIM24 family)